MGLRERFIPYRRAGRMEGLSPSLAIVTWIASVSTRCHCDDRFASADVPRALGIHYRGKVFHECHVGAVTGRRMD